MAGFSAKPGDGSPVVGTENVGLTITRAPSGTRADVTKFRRTREPERRPVDVDALDPTKTHEIAAFKHEIALTTLRVDPTGRFAAAGAEDLDVQLWDLEGDRHRTLKGHQSWVRSIDFSADGERIFTACWGGDILVWDTSQDEPKPLQTIHAHQGSARFVRLSPDGKRLATCGNDLKVKVWNVEDGKQLHEFAGHNRHVYGVDFHPDGNHLASQDLMGEILIWDLQSGKQQCAAPDPECEPDSLPHRSPGANRQSTAVFAGRSPRVDSIYRKT